MNLGATVFCSSDAENNGAGSGSTQTPMATTRDAKEGGSTSALFVKAMLYPEGSRRMDDVYGSLGDGEGSAAGDRATGGASNRNPTCTMRGVGMASGESAPNTAPRASTATPAVVLPRTAATLAASLD